MVLGAAAAAAASCEMMRFADSRHVAHLASFAGDGGVICRRHCGRAGESGCQRKVVSLKQKKQIAPCNRAFRILAVLDKSEALANQVSVSRTAAAIKTRNNRDVVAKSLLHTVNVATIATESSVCTDVAVDEVCAIARAAAKAARDAARDAAAYAEAQAIADDSEQVFPSEQDLLLLERARLTEMARSGAVQLNPADTLNDEDKAARNKLKDWGFSTAFYLDLDSDTGEKLRVSSRTLELEQRGLLELQTGDETLEGVEQQETSVGESIRRSGGGITVRSSRRRERILKRERALMRAELTAASPLNPSVSKAKKPQPGYDSSDPVRAYLRDISKTKLLTAAEEVGLAEGIQDLLRIESVKTDLMEQMGREPSLLEWAKAVGTENQSLETRIKSGQACKDKMVNSNLRLVVSIAKRYQGRGMTIQDLIQEGSMGLIRGAEKFDHTRGFKFSTYAHWWIRQAITRAIADQSRTIRLPVHVYELLSRITKAKSMLAAEHGRVARDEEIAELVGLNIEKLKLVIKSAKCPKSLEFPVGKNNDTILQEVIPDKEFDTPEEAITKRLLKQDLNAVLNTLNPRERDVLKLRYGLDDGRMRTLEEIGNVFSVTRERIRQIEAKALRKLRQPSRNTALREYLDQNI